MLPEGNEQCSGKSAPKPQSAHILAVGSHQSLFTGLFLALKNPVVLPRPAPSQQRPSGFSGLYLFCEVGPWRVLGSKWPRPRTQEDLKTQLAANWALAVGSSLYSAPGVYSQLPYNLPVVSICLPYQSIDFLEGKDCYPTQYLGFSLGQDWAHNHTWGQILLCLAQGRYTVETYSLCSEQVFSRWYWGYTKEDPLSTGRKAKELQQRCDMSPLAPQTSNQLWAGSSQARFLQVLPEETAGAVRANSSTEGRDPAQPCCPKSLGPAYWLPGPPAIVTSVLRCFVSLCGPRVPPSSLQRQHTAVLVISPPPESECTEHDRNQFGCVGNVKKQEIVSRTISSRPG